MLTIQQSSTFNAYKISTMEVNSTSSFLQLAERAIQLFTNTGAKNPLLHNTRMEDW